VQIAALREHGHLGLGTFESLAGEMVGGGGHFFQVRSDGSVREVPFLGCTMVAELLPNSGSLLNNEATHPNVTY
jgi:alpha-acetolactate decarboxylase